MAFGRELAQLAARNAGVPEDFFLRLVQQESGWNPKARSPVGAYGLTQAMPATWQNPGFGVKPGGNINDPQEQLRFGADYSAAMLNRYGGDPVRAAAAYNWGAGNVDKWDGRMESLPAETRDYVQKVALGGGTIADQPQVMSLLENYGQQAEGPGQSSRAATLADVMSRQEGEGGVTFHPGLALQSIGAAIAAGSQGESAAGALDQIRRSYYAEREGMQEKRLKEMQREALISMVGAESEFGQALMNGADPGDVMNAYTQALAHRHAAALQSDQQAFTRSENQLDREQRGQEFGLTYGLQERGQTFDELKYYTTDQSMRSQGAAAKSVLSSVLGASGAQDMADQIAAMPDSAFGDPAMVSQLADILINPKSTADQRTAAIKDFEYRQSLSDEDREAFDQSRRASGTNVNIDMGTKGQQIAQEERIKREQKELGTLSDNVNNKSQMLTSLDQMEMMLEQNPDLDTGMFYQYLAPVVEGMRMAGIAPEGWVADFSTRAGLRQLNEFMSTYMRQAGAGATSDFEAKMYQSTAPGPNETIQTTTRRIRQLKDSILRDSERLTFLEDYVATPKEDGSMPTLAEARKEWLRLSEEGDPRTMPSGHDFMKFTPDNLKKLGPIEPGDWYRDPDGKLLQATPESAAVLNKVLFSSPAASTGSNKAANTAPPVTTIIEEAPAPAPVAAARPASKPSELNKFGGSSSSEVPLLVTGPDGKYMQTREPRDPVEARLLELARKQGAL